jgi:predicted SAM-dependent methyltransferase
MNKLHIGCGKNYIPGWTNLDLFSSVKADVYADITALPFDRGSFDLIYASHVLEHVQRNTVVATLSHWRDLLKEGGVLRLAVPNFEAVVKWYSKTGNLMDVLGLLYGGQNHPKNNHFVTFDSNTLRRDLIRAGFSEIRFWDWKTTDHAAFDDYSQCYLPHMDKDNGMLMSLNLEAVK